MYRVFAAVAFLVQVALVSSVQACEIAKPEGDVILVVDGMINACNEGLEVHLDREMITALPRKAITTDNPWDKGPSTYEGVALGDLLRYVRSDGTRIVATALNDYRAEIPVADLDAHGVILAYRRDGVDLPVRDKGPLFVVFPFSDKPELRTDARYAQSVWQVNRITVK